MSENKEHDQHEDDWVGPTTAETVHEWICLTPIAWTFAYVVYTLGDLILAVAERVRSGGF